MRRDGSSPRERGTRAEDQRRQERLRFIPARAGNTRTAAQRILTNSVHPRASGEHDVLEVAGPAGDGSSPRERGTRHPQARARLRDRFIPARAGNTLLLTAAFNPTPVHPRASGEHTPHRRLAHAARGSSPRERGTQRHLAGAALAVRFIPPRAGNTKSRAAASAARSVHPRASGEHDLWAAGRSWCTGSSPRERGTPAFRRINRGYWRFIPARAGNTFAQL